MQRLVFAIMLALLPVSTVFASSVLYNYTGESFDTLDGTLYDTSMRVTFNFEMDAPLGAGLYHQVVNPLSFKFSDGVNSILSTDADLYESYFKFSTDAAGDITDWTAYASAGTRDLTAVGESKMAIRSYTFISGGVKKVFDRGRQETCNFAPAGDCTRVDLEGGYIIAPLASADSVPAPVPIPAAAWLFGTAVMAGGIVGRRKKQAA
jgi:hypothetical protein